MSIKFNREQLREFMKEHIQSHILFDLQSAISPFPGDMFNEILLLDVEDFEKNESIIREMFEQVQEVNGGLYDDADLFLSEIVKLYDIYHELA